MKDDKQSNSDREPGDTLAALLNLAGPNPKIPDDVRQRVYSKVRGTWDQSRSGSRAIRWALPAALAASLLLAFFVGNKEPAVPPTTAGTVVLATGMGQSTAPGVGNAVYVGDVIDTGTDGALSIKLRGDLSLRVDKGTLLEIDAVDKFTLMAGRIYVDTGDRIYSNRHVTVTTASGSARDVGTQFSVQYADANMMVAVREGRVDLSDDRETYKAERGELVTLRPGQSVQRGTVPVAGPAWEWAVALAPEFELDNRSLLDFLKWVERETGMHVVYENDDVRAAAVTSRLYGHIAGLNPLEAVDSVLATTRFSYSIEEDTIFIRH